MARPKKTSKTNAALARRSVAAAEAKKKRLLAEAKALLALVWRRKKEITEAFYDVGEALARLRQKEMLAVLGRRSFAELCEKDAGLSAATGQRLVEITLAMTREEAIGMGQTKAMAMVSLAQATPEVDTPAGLYRGAVTLPGGKKLAPRTASATEVEEAAAQIRQARGGPRRGRTTTKSERELAERLEARLHALGLDRARVSVVATKPGQEADLRIERVPASRVGDLKRALGR